MSAPIRILCFDINKSFCRSGVGVGVGVGVVPFCSSQITMATAKPRVKCRKPLGVRGLRKFSRSEMYHKRELWAIRAAYGGSFPRYGPKAAGGGELRKFYSAQA